MNVKYRRNSILLFATAVFIGLFSFQNCAPAKMNSSFQSSTAGLELQSAPNNYAQSSGISDGRCGTTPNNCQAGQYLNVADTAEQSLWRCAGTNGGASVLCSTNFSNLPVQGMCSSVRNQCIQGQPEDVPDSTSKQLWNCKGFNGGSTDFCDIDVDTSKLPQDGKCGTTTNSCDPGVAVDFPADTATAQQWTCNGINGGISKLCSIAIVSPLDARCGTSYYSCEVGTVSEQTSNSNSFNWKCLKTDGTYKTCQATKPTCTLGVDGTNTVKTTHYKDTYTYNVAVATGSLPAQVILKVYGERADLGSSTYVTDETGATDYPKATPIAWTFTNPGGAKAGNYKRKLSILDATTRVELCQTTYVFQTLTPACNLSVDKSIYTLAESIVATFDFAVVNQPMLPKIPGVIFWKGQKNGVDDETGLSPYSFTLNGSIGTRTFSPLAVGNYSRYFIAKETASSTEELCKSEKISFTVETPPPPAPVNGACGTLVDSCTSGTYTIGTGNDADTATEDRWLCKGVNNGTDASCSLTKPVIIVPNPTVPPPVCGRIKGSCASGTPTPIDRTFIDVNSCDVQWTCENSNGEVDYCSMQIFNRTYCNQIIP